MYRSNKDLTFNTPLIHPMNAQCTKTLIVLMLGLVLFVKSKIKSRLHSGMFKECSSTSEEIIDLISELYLKRIIRIVISSPLLVMEDVTFAGHFFLRAKILQGSKERHQLEVIGDLLSKHSSLVYIPCLWL